MFNRHSILLTNNLDLPCENGKRKKCESETQCESESESKGESESETKGESESSTHHKYVIAVPLFGQCKRYGWFVYCRLGTICSVENIHVTTRVRR